MWKISTETIYWNKNFMISPQNPPSLYAYLSTKKPPSWLNMPKRLCYIPRRSHLSVLFARLRGNLARSPAWHLWSQKPLGEKTPIFQLVLEGTGGKSHLERMIFLFLCASFSGFSRGCLRITLEKGHAGSAKDKTTRLFDDFNRLWLE